MTIVEHLLLSNIIYIPKKNNAGLEIPLLNAIIADLRNLINNITSRSGGGGDPNEPDIGYA